LNTEEKKQEEILRKVPIPPETIFKKRKPDLSKINSNGGIEGRTFIRRKILDNISECSLRSARSRSDCSCPRILIVDDDFFCITALKAMLEVRHLESDYAINGQ